MSLYLRVEFQPAEPNMNDETLVVLAADNLVAASLFCPFLILVASVLGHDMYATGNDKRESVVKRWMENSDRLRSTAYVCEHCHVSTAKDRWGPGRITCPRCGRMANAADGSPRP